MCEDAYKCVKYRGYTILIEPDEFPEDPRDWDNFGTMACFHRRYSLGDEHDFSAEEIKRHVDREDVISLPLYLYDHSEITMSTTPFSCRWDSGQVGFIVADRAMILAEFGGKYLTRKKRERALKMMREGVELYDLYLRGEVYGYTLLDPFGKDIDSCCGFFGDDGIKYIEEEVKADIDRRIAEDTTSPGGEQMSLSLERKEEAYV